MRDSEIVSLLTPVLSQFGLELETVEVVPAGKRRLLRVVVDGDGPEGRGPLLDDIADASKAISAVLDDSTAAGSAPYTLEVSSRGLGRPLERPQHWRRNRGRLVAVTLIDGQELVARVSGVEEEAVVLVVDGAERRLPYGEISRALVQVEFRRAESGEESED